MSTNFITSISYGKFHIPLYRVYARPLLGITSIPESHFAGRSNTLLAMEVDVEVFGNNFLPAYTDGDNSNVVATDSMKNFVLRQALAFDGATMEEFLAFLGTRFLTTYPQMERIRLSGRELPFLPAINECNPTEHTVLWRSSPGHFATSKLEFARENEQVVITAHDCGIKNLELFKVTGSAFTHFVRDEYTTLPERVDRPLFIHLDVAWEYEKLDTLLQPDHSTYVPAEQVRDLVQSVFNEFVSESIQHLVYTFGGRLLDRFPQLKTISFEAHNLTRDLAAMLSDEEQARVYTDPFTAFGTIKLTLARPK